MATHTPSPLAQHIPDTATPRELATSGIEHKIGYFFAILGIVFAYLFLGGFFCLGMQNAFGLNQISSTAIFDSVFAIVLVVVAYLWGKTSSFFDGFCFGKWSFTGLETLGYFAEFLCVCFLCQISATTVNNLIVDTGYQTYQATSSSASTEVAFLLTLIIAPIFEELLYRGVVFRGFCRVMPPWLAMALSSLIFGASHGTILHMFSGTLMGLFCCLIYYKTNRITIPILVHFGFNCFSVLSIAINVPDWMCTLWFVVPCLLVLCVEIFSQLYQVETDREFEVKCRRVSIENLAIPNAEKREVLEIGNECDAKMNQSRNKLKKLSKIKV